MFIFIMLDSALDGFKIAPEWIGLLKGLLMTAVGGYFVIRGAEKITKGYKKVNPCISARVYPSCGVGQTSNSQALF